MAVSAQNRLSFVALYDAVVQRLGNDLIDHTALGCCTH